MADSKKSARYAYVKSKKASIYNEMDNHLKSKSIKKFKQYTKKKPDIIEIPEQCRNCKFRISMCWINKQRYTGIDFNCNQKIKEIKKNG